MVNSMNLSARIDDSERYRIWETNYGRDAGWILEYCGEPLAILSECRFERLFWDSYRLEITASDNRLRDAAATEEFWQRIAPGELRFINREFGITIDTALVAGDPFPEPGRLMVRGVYIPIDPPSLWCSLRLWFQRRRLNG